MKTKIILIIFILITILPSIIFATESGDNTNLQVMRINVEGISPNFQKDVKEYYIAVDSKVNKLEVTAIPESEGATVQITGNENLKEGLNTIEIKVVSRDKSKKTSYKIYVTKTKNVAKANTNLENLAVREAMLYPAFDANITEYDIELEENTEKVDILAIPEDINAEVKIVGNENLKEGDNLIEIIVTADDKITQKKYKINAYRRNKEEEVIANEEKQKQIEELSTIMEELEVEENRKEDKKNNDYGYVVIVLLIITAIIASVYVWIIKNKRQ